MNKPRTIDSTWGDRLRHGHMSVRVFAIVLALLIQQAQGTSLDLYRYSCAKSEANCCFPETPWSNGYPRFRCGPSADGTYPCSLKLSVSDWAGSFANAFVMKVLIEEFLGYPVEIKGDFSTLEGVDIGQEKWQSMINGSTDAVLEYWPSGENDDNSQFILQEESIVNAGSLGLVGKIGWYTNSFALDIDPNIEYWRYLHSSVNQSIFANPETSLNCCPANTYTQPDVFLPCIPSEDLGGTPVLFGGFNDTLTCNATSPHLVPTHAMRFLSSSKKWREYDAQIIRNLSLNMTLQYAGNEAVIAREIINANATQTPLLFYFWEPHGIFQKFNLTRIFLPEKSNSCQEKVSTGQADCDYPVDILSKAYSNRVLLEKPDAALLINAFRYKSNSEQEQMIYSYYESSDENITWNEIACQWIQEHTSTVTSWKDTVKERFSNEVWQNEILEPTYQLCECQASGLRDIVEIYNTSLYTDTGNVLIDVDKNPCSTNRSATIYRTRWTTMTLPTKIHKITLCHYVPTFSSEASVIKVLTGASIGILLICFVLLITYRRRQATRAARVRTLSLFLLGAALMNLASLFSIGEITKTRCVLRFHFLVFGVSFYVGTLLIKQYAIVVALNVFNRGNRESRAKARFLLTYDAPICFIAGAIPCIFWYLITGFTPVEYSVDHDLDLTELICPHSSILLMVFVAAGYLFIILSCLLASQTWRYPGLIFSEAKFMLFSNYNVAILTAFSLLVSLSSGIGENLKVLFVSICIFFSTVSCAILVVGSRIYAGFYNMRSYEAQRENSHPLSGNNQGIVKPI